MDQVLKELEAASATAKERHAHTEIETERDRDRHKTQRQRQRHRETKNLHSLLISLEHFPHLCYWLPGEACLFISFDRGNESYKNRHRKTKTTQLLTCDA